MDYYSSSSASFFHVYEPYFLPMRYAEPHALCPPPDASLSWPLSFVSDPPTWLPSVLVGHLYGLRSPLGAAPGLRASVPVTALRWAAMNSRRSVFTMQGEVAAAGGGGANLGPGVEAGAAPGAAAACCGPAAAAAVCARAAGAADASSAPDVRPFLEDGHGRLASNDPCTSYRITDLHPAAYITYVYV